MAVNIKNIDNSEKVWHSITGYRILFALKLLLEKCYTSKELIEVLKENTTGNKAVSIDTFRLVINTLKAAGCIFNRPSKANNYQYKLLSHPFILNLSQDEISKLISLREYLAKELNFREIMDLNNLYEKIADLTFNEENKLNFEDTKPLKFIDKELFNKISNPEIINKKLYILYNSPQFGQEDFEIIPQKIVYENEKAYIWGYNCKYESLSLINIERIIEIKNISPVENFNAPKVYDVVYEIFGESIDNFEPKDYEEVLSESKDKVTVKASVSNEFIFIQRILMFGNCFKIISPVFFKEILINKIKLIQKGYINE